MAKKKAKDIGEGVAEILDNIREFFSDTSRSQQDTLADLKEIRDEVQMNIDAIEDDLIDAIEDDLRNGRG